MVAKPRFIITSSSGTKVGSGYYSDLDTAIDEAETLNGGSNQPWDAYIVVPIFVGDWAEHA